MVVGVSLLLVGMQLAGFADIVAKGYLSYEGKQVLTTKYINEYSSDRNIIVFIVDRLDYDYVEGIMKSNPIFFERLEGFTSYTNATSEFARTDLP